MCSKYIQSPIEFLRRPKLKIKTKNLTEVDWKTNQTGENKPKMEEKITDLTESKLLTQAGLENAQRGSTSTVWNKVWFNIL